MSKLDELGKQIKVLQQKYDDLEAEKEKPEYPDRTPGYFGINAQFGYLKNNIGGQYPYRAYTEKEFYNKIDGYREFIPLTEAILPMAVEYDGMEYPDDQGDHLFIEYKDGHFLSGQANELVWPDTSKLRYWVIKKA